MVKRQLQTKDRCKIDICKQREMSNFHSLPKNISISKIRYKSSSHLDQV
ncbi:hypothetical protein LEP1GSC066_2180 [Leptospira sp. serovar Kenya str. Sh9]|nr:hypothetical protein LEP1GSC066_2180 [Leptospira sp. serovar Kenya str. Sh9]